MLLDLNICEHIILCKVPHYRGKYLVIFACFYLNIRVYSDVKNALRSSVIINSICDANLLKPQRQKHVCISFKEILPSCA